MKKTITRMMVIITLCLFSKTGHMMPTDEVKNHEVTTTEPERVSVSGKASYYSDCFNGRRTASGEVFRQSKLTAASNRFTFGTQLKVTNVKNGKTVVVKINDRMGHKTRLVDLSTQAAKRLGFFGHGLTDVIVEIF